jgi:hypothetical protein
MYFAPEPPKRRKGRETKCFPAFSSLVKSNDKTLSGK